jgi:hypothetical protein
MCACDLFRLEPRDAIACALNACLAADPCSHQLALTIEIELRGRKFGSTPLLRRFLSCGPRASQRSFCALDFSLRAPVCRSVGARFFDFGLCHEQARSCEI